MYKIQFDAIGTQWGIETPEPLPKRITSDVHHIIEEYDAIYSRFRQDSLVARVSEKAGLYVFPDNNVQLIAFYKKLYDVTEGAVSPLIGKRLEEIGYDASYSFTPRNTRSKVPTWDGVMTWDDNTLHSRLPLLLDFGAAGKGHLVDIIGEYLQSQGILTYTIDASGDIRRRGASSERVGLENPYDATSVIGVMSLENGSMCASATNRRMWGDGLHHIVDARTGEPVHNIVATWVKHDSTLVADGLATALFFSDPKILQKQWDFEYVILHENGKVAHSDVFMGELFI